MSRKLKVFVLSFMVAIFLGSLHSFTAADVVFAATRRANKAKTATATTTTTSNSANALFAQKGNKFLSDIRWRPGTVFNGKQKPKLSPYNCIGCCAYAADFVKYVFGKNSPRDGVLFKNINQIRKGDLIVVTRPSHWIIVVGRNGNSLSTIEGNWAGGKVDRSNGAYTIHNGKLLRNGKPYRTFSYGYHFM